MTSSCRRRPGRRHRGARALHLLIGLWALASVLACAPAGGEGAAVPAGGQVASEPGAVVTLSFFDVGQGDAVLIRAPSGRAVLYDGGQSGDRILEHLEAVGVEAIELVIASHNHADHIGGLAAVIERYRPPFVMENGVPHTTRAYERFLAATAAAGSQRLEPERRTITLDGLRITVLPPPGDPRLGHNDNSVGLRVEYGEFSATLLGDAEPAQHRWWIEEHGDLLAPVRVHKASHHGSRNGDTAGLLDLIRPDVIVIGVGADNRYGHPHPEALERYRAIGARVYRTDRNGTVTISADPDGSIRTSTASSAAAAASAISTTVP